MKKSYTLIITVFILMAGRIIAQPSSCATAVEFCTSSNYYFSNVTNVGSIGSGGIYGCLGSTPNAKWFYMQVTTPGNIIFTINQTSLNGTALDVDFVCYGPFNSPSDGCPIIADTSMAGDSIVSCSYSGSAAEVVTINGALAGQYYMLLCTNFSNQPGTITFVQSANSTGTSQCTSTCSVAGVTALPGACSYPTSTYTLTGQVSFQSSPASGNLVITSTNGGSVSIPYPWTSPVSYSIPNLNSTGLGATVTASFTADGTCFHTTNYTSPSPCLTCFVSSNNNGPICSGSTLNLMATTFANTTYVWAGPNGFTSNLQNPSIPLATVASAGTYTLTAEDTVNNTTCISSTTVIMTPAPTVNVTDSVLVCSGQSAILTATPSAAGGNYMWMPGGETTQSITITPTTSDNYIVTYTLPGCIVSAIDTSVVIVNPTPVVTCNSTSICAGQSAALTATPSIAGGTYYWLTGHQTSQSIAVSPAVTTTYVVFYTLDGCTNTAGGTVTLITNPIITVNSTTICSGQSATLTANALPLTGSYLWSGGAGTTQSVAVSPTTTTTYSVTYTSIGCANTGGDTATVFVNPTPTVTSNSDTICSGQSTTLTASGAATYVWQPNNISGNTITVSPAITSSYTVTGTTVGCSDNSTSIVLVNATPPVPVISPIGTMLSSSSATGNQWYMNGGVIAGETNQTYTPTQNGTYTVFVSAGDCSSESLPFVITNIGIDELANTYSFGIYPNPFNSTSSVHYSLTTSAKVSIEIENELGEKIISVLNSAKQNAGDYQYEISLNESGVYFVKMQTETGVFVKRIVSIK